MVLGIVGAEAAKFTEKGMHDAYNVIIHYINELKPDAISSGHCHLGGIDIWAEEIAKKRRLYKNDLIFPPAEYGWSNGYKPRNIRIVKASDFLLNITVDKLPSGFDGMTFKGCYHCVQRGVVTPHVKSGGCWTMWLAAESGKQYKHIVINNY